METFIYKIFADMKGLSNLLDIGWFLWESAVYLAEHNKAVSCYELSQKNFSYLTVNCKGVKNLHFYNGAVTTSDTEHVEYLEDSEVDSTVKIDLSSTQKTISVKNYNILTLLKENAYDGIKLDIEGGEYDILRTLLQESDLFNFTKWIIEFHDLNLSPNLTFLKEFIAFIVKKWYSYYLITNENQKITDAEILAYKFCNIYFELH